ncbi:MAG TPA: YfjI family protein [Bryobacteraceae bacterium]|nr:YfjI family protein [Bryobacteraceae bacterium]
MNRATHTIIDDSLSWPLPEALGDDLLPVPPFEAAMLPEAFREHVSDVAERMQIPVDLPAVCAVACLAGVVNRRAIIRPKRADASWTVTPNLWAAIIAPPGRMKSNVLGTFTAPLARIEARWRTEFDSAISEYESWARERELRQQAWAEQFKSAIKKGVAPPPRPDDAREKPGLRRLVANDPTFEALHNILAESPAGVLLIRDELSGWLATLDKPGREGERQFYLEAWNGNRPFTVDRIGRGTIHVPALCLSIIGGIQPGRLRQYLVDAVKDGPGNDGLFQRLQLTVWPDFPKSWTLVDRPENSDAATRVAAVYERLAELSSDEPLRFRFSDEAQELFYTWWPELERKICAGDLHPALTAHLAKYRSLMPSLALLFELADSEPPGASTEVSLCHAAQAAAWCDFLENHARRIYGCLVSPALHAARVLADKITKGKLAGEFSTRDVYRPGWEGLTTPDDARAALRILEDAGWVRPVQDDEGEGRPSERWRVNPRIAEVGQ